MTTTVMYYDDRFAALAVDSLIAGTEGDDAVYCSKAYQLPHLRMIFSMTGLVTACDAMHTTLNRFLCRGDVDDLAKKGAEFAFAVIEATERAWMAAGIDPLAVMDARDNDRLGEAYILAWSRRQGRIVGYLVDYGRPEDGFREIPERRLIGVPSAWMHSGVAGGIDIPGDFVGMLREAYAQQNDGRYGDGPGPHVGGDMLLSLLTEKEIRTRHVGAFPNVTADSAWAEMEQVLQRAVA